MLGRGSWMWPFSSRLSWALSIPDRGNLVQAQPRRFPRPAERPDEFPEGFRLDLRGGRGRDRPGFAILAIQGLADPPLLLAIFGRLNPSDGRFRPCPFLGRQGSQGLPRTLGKAARFHGDQSPYSGTG